MKHLFCVCVSLILFATAYGQKTEENKAANEKTFTGDAVEFTCIHPVTEESIPLKVILPKGWKLNPDFGTVVYEPANAFDYYEPPRIEFQVKCEGECKADVIPENIKGFMQGLMDGWKTLATGDPELDKLGTNVEIIKEKMSEGKMLLEVKLTYPEGVSDAMYPPRYWIYLFLYNAQDPFFIFVKGKVPVNLADEFLSDVYASCMTAAKR